MFSALSDYDIVGMFHDIVMCQKSPCLTFLLWPYQFIVRTDESSLKFIHFPIKDCDVSDDIRVMDLAMKLVTALSAGKYMKQHSSRKLS